jgi:transcriptional regulator with XRE-family HTH domain
MTTDLHLPPESQLRVKKARNLVARIQLLTLWSQVDLAVHMGISSQTVSNWMNGHRAPTQATVSQLGFILKRIQTKIRVDKKAQEKLAKVRAHPTATRLQMKDRPLTREVTYG